MTNKAKNLKNPLLYAVRAAFVARHTSLSAWCKNNGITREWATRCLTGKASGNAANAMTQRLVDASGVDVTQLVAGTSIHLDETSNH